MEALEVIYGALLSMQEVVESRFRRRGILFARGAGGARGAGEARGDGVDPLCAMLYAGGCGERVLSIAIRSSGARRGTWRCGGIEL